MAARRQASPAPAQVLDRLQQDIEKGLPPGLYTLSGDDLYHLDAAQKAILEHVMPSGTSEFALTVFGEDKVSVGTVVAAARSAGMFATRRVVLVRELSALEGEPDAILDYVKAPPADSYLIVRAPALDQRFKLHKALGSKGRHLRFATPGAGDSRAAIAAVKKMATARKLKLDPRAAAFLAEITAGDLYRLGSELDKLAAWVASESDPLITLEGAREVAAGSDLLSGWEVADAIMVRDRSAGLAAVARLVESGDEPIRLVGGLAWRARTMLQAKALLDRGMPAQQVVQATRSWGYRDELMSGLRRYSLQELLAFPALLLEADRALKSRGIGSREVLENLVHRMTGPTPKELR